MAERKVIKQPDWATWKQDEPPWEEIARQQRKKRLRLTIWGRFMVWCVAHPDEWFRSHALLRKHAAQQAASDIKQWRKQTRSDRVIGYNEDGSETGPKDGKWETYWGHKPDDNMLEQWYVWAKWVPNKPEQPSPSKTRAPVKKKETNGRAK